jgi:hypothetical protein
LDDARVSERRSDYADMKTSLALIASIVLIAFAAGCAHSHHHQAQKAPTGAPAEQPMRASGSSTGGTGGPR